MRIFNYATSFVENYEPTIPYLNKYFATYREHYDYYFANHCKNKEEKLILALEKHPLHLAQITESVEKMPQIINQTKRFYEKNYNILFTQDVHLLVGLYGSNAYTHRQFNPKISFCLEKLSSIVEHLQVIVAHEFGHAAHHLISMNENILWTIVNWTSPYTWLLQEGVATYLSMQAVQTEEDIYFSFEEDKEWLEYCKRNETDIIRKFVQDLENETTQYLFKEWFSINGGDTFGYTRLAYYIAYSVVKQLINQMGEISTFMLWNDHQFNTIMSQQLEKLVHSN